MNEIQLKYGCNPHQKPARIFMENGGELPVTVLSGNPGYINFLDALNGWQLVTEMKAALGMPAAASFKHVSPTSAAVGVCLSPALKKACFVDDVEGLDDSPLACAYARARGTDRMSSFGDWILLSEICDLPTARLIKREVSDGVIAPGYTAEAFELLKTKRKGNYNIVQMDKSYSPAPAERKQVFGISFEQGRNDASFTKDSFNNIVTQKKELPQSAVRDMTVAMITLKYTQSNSVCFAVDGQAIGVGAGQQSRIHCTRLAGDKADLWRLRQHPKTLSLPFLPELGRPERDNAVDIFLSPRPQEILEDGVWQGFFSEKPEAFTMEEKEAYLKSSRGVALGSDAFFPFDDNIERAYRSGVDYIAQPGGSIRDPLVIAACDRHGMVMAMTGIRLFHH